MNLVVSPIRKSKLGEYNNEDLVLRLPKGKLITDYKWISVWCRTFYVSITIKK